MIDFQKSIGPHGIPVYYQILPDIVESVAIEYLLFTGAADDAVVGTNGAYHWFEHVPFRGTHDFPGGYSATKGLFPKRGGRISAGTSYLTTSFWGRVHKSQVTQAMHVLTDLWSRPIMSPSSIEAEREIIFGEIREAESDIKKSSLKSLTGILWRGHPLGHRVLGTRESLARLDSSVLQRAHQLGYSTSRAVLFLAGSKIALQVAQEQLEEIQNILPVVNISERRKPQSYGPLPAWQPGKTTVIETGFANSWIAVLFPRTPKQDWYQQALAHVVRGVISHGDLSSPLYQIVREKYNLGYSTGVVNYSFPDGGTMGISVNTSADQLEKARSAIYEVTTSERVRSAERLEEVVTAWEYGQAMMPLDPQKFTDIAQNYLMAFGDVLSDNTVNELYRSIKHTDVLRVLDQCTESVAHTIIFRGK